MSEYLTIKEDGIGRVFGGTDKLITPLQSGGSCAWVPESETQLTTKSIDQNGIYVAADDGDYGWNSVTVNVQAVDGITGTGQDGKQHTISTDPTTGELVNNVAPVEIRVTAGPTHIGPYMPGTIIDLAGIVVHAYDSSGEDMGAVPFNELAFPVTVAEYNPATIPGPGSVSNTDMDTSPVTQPFNISNGNVVHYDFTSDASYDETELKPRFYYVGDNSNLHKLYANETQASNVVVGRQEWSSGIIIDDVVHFGTTHEYTYDGKTVYWVVMGSFDNSWPDKVQNLNLRPYIGDISNELAGKIAWAMVYGNVKNGGNTLVPVEWARPGDRIVLSTNFYITVAAITGGGGQAGDNGTGRND